MSQTGNYTKPFTEEYYIKMALRNYIWDNAKFAKKHNVLFEEHMVCRSTKDRLAVYKKYATEKEYNRLIEIIKGELCDTK